MLRIVRACAWKALGAKRGSTRGQILPLVALALVALLGMAALAIDVGYYRYQQRLEQAAADSAALAGGIQLGYGQSLAKIQAAGLADAAANGFSDDKGVTVSVVVNNPPASPSAYAGSPQAVQAIVQKKQPVFFGGIFGSNFQWIAARAVAAENSAGRGCIYALHKSGNALLINGTTVNVPACGMSSNGDLLVNGSTVTASSIDYVGSESHNGSTFPRATPKKAIPVADPCGSLAGCQYLAANPPAAGSCMARSSFGPGAVVISPGTYCSQLLCNGCSSVTFNAGLYVLKQGLLMNGSANVSGSNVTFYNEGSSFTFNGSGGSLSAPSSGNYTGVLLYQVPGDTSAVVLNGSSGSLAGAVYAPKAQITLNGGFSNWLLAVGDTVLINGSGLTVAGSALPGFGHFVLAE